MDAEVKEITKKMQQKEDIKKQKKDASCANMKR